MTPRTGLLLGAAVAAVAILGRESPRRNPSRRHRANPSSVERSVFGSAWTRLTQEQRDVVRDDIADMVREGDAPWSLEAAKLLNRRIGGPSALDSYAKVLIAGRRRRQR